MWKEKFKKSFRKILISQNTLSHFLKLLKTELIWRVTSWSISGYSVTATLSGRTYSSAIGNLNIGKMYYHKWSSLRTNQTLFYWVVQNWFIPEESSATKCSSQSYVLLSRGDIEKIGNVELSELIKLYQMYSWPQQNNCRTDHTQSRTTRILSVVSCDTLCCSQDWAGDPLLLLWPRVPEPELGPHRLLCARPAPICLHHHQSRGNKNNSQ